MRGRGSRALLPAIRALFVAGCAALLAGCAHDITRLSHDCEGAGGWCPEARTVSGTTWQYAQLAQNAYWQNVDDRNRYVDRLYVLPPGFFERHASVDDRFGYAYSVYDRIDENGRLREVVLAYRGTEGPKDWWHGTLLGRQGPRGLATYRQVRAALDAAGYDSVPVTLVGHSLGGRIADHVTKRLLAQEGELPPVLSVYLFNPNAGGSLLGPLPTDGEGPVRTAVSEQGEIAGWVRAAAIDRAWDGYVIDCQTTVDPIKRHYMRRLADCLTWIAATDDADAAYSIDRNEIAPPPVAAGMPVQGDPASQHEAAHSAAGAAG